jgi:two-component system LytT family response regulator
MEKIKALIIDDEKLARKIIREYLISHPEVEISGECQDAYQAFESVEKHQPDLLFLDVQMPEIDGFQFLDMLDEIPFVIFSTAYDQHALKAFEFNAVDFLLKPFDQARFDIALERVKKLMKQESGESDKIKSLLHFVQAQKPYLENIMVKRSGRIIVLHADEIQRIEAVGDYAALYTSKGTYMVAKSMNFLETRLDPARFVRTHRSVIINLEAVKEIFKWTKGRLKIVMKDGHEMVPSRSGTKKLKKFML